MLITRPFTNEEVAERLEALRSAAGLNWEHHGILAEACRRLRGQPCSGCPTANHPLPTIEPHLLEVGK